MALAPTPCPACGKKIFQRAHLEGHLQSLNCRVRTWKRVKTKEDWHHVKMSWRPFFDEHGIPYAVAPCEPRQGQFIMVPRYIHAVLKKARVRFETFTGPVWIDRPRKVIETWVRAAETRRKDNSRLSTL